MIELTKYDSFKQLTDRGKLITAYLYENYGFNTDIKLSVVNGIITEFECLGLEINQQDLNIFLNEMFLIRWHKVGCNIFHLHLTLKNANPTNKGEYYSDYLKIMKTHFDYRIEQFIYGMSEKELKKLIVGANKYKQGSDKFINPITFIKSKKYLNYLD